MTTATAAATAATDSAAATAVPAAERVDDAVRRAHSAQPGWADRPLDERCDALRRLADLVERDAAVLAELDARESGRPLRELVDGDLPSSVEALRWFADAARTAPGTVFSQGPTHLAYEVPRPVGVGAAVLPWNFPLAMAVWKVGPALVTGNGLVLKPAPPTPASARHLRGLALEAGLPQGLLEVVEGDGDVGAALVTHPLVGAVSFTGSVATGREVAAACARSNLARVSLELGGKSAHVVLPDALGLGDRLVDGLAEAAFLASGQNCTAGSRVLVHEDVVGDVAGALAERAEALVVGPYDDPSADLGPLVTEAALTRVEGLVARAVAAGARVLAGGRRSTGTARGYRPTVLTDVAADSEIEQTEVFGPVVSVSSFATVDEAVERANGTPYGLAGAVWTRDLRLAHDVARRLRAGVVSVNCYSEGDIRTPFGGLGHSGTGVPEKSARALEQWRTRGAVWADLS